MEKIIIIGTGNNSKEVAAFIRRYNLFEIVGYAVNKKYLKENEYEGLPVYASEDLEQCVDKRSVLLFIGIAWGQRLNQVRKDIFDELKAKGFSFANLIAPQAVVMSEKTGEGNWFHDFCYVSHDTQIGDNNEFRAFSTIGHYTTVGSHNHFSKCTIGGATKIGDCNFVGMQAIVYNRVNVGNKNFIGAGTIVKKDLGDFNVVSAVESLRTQLTERQIEYVVSPSGKNFLK